MRINKLGFYLIFALISIVLVVALSQYQLGEKWLRESDIEYSKNHTCPDGMAMMKFHRYGDYYCLTVPVKK